MPAIREVDAIWARQIAAQLEARGRAAGPVLQQVGLNRRSLQSAGSRIPFAKHVAFLEAAARQLNDDCFGLHFGSSVDPLDAGALGYIAVNSPRLELALDNLVTYLGTFTEGTAAIFEIEAQHAAFGMQVLDPSVTRFQQIHEAGLAMALNLCRFVVCKRLIPVRVEFQHERQDNRDEFARYFGCEIRFASRRNVIVLDRALLALPCDKADDRLLQILKSHCDDLLAQKRQTDDFRDEVEHLIASRVSSGPPVAKVIASKLGMSERTLARRLTQLGLTFGQIVDGIRRDLALKYLSEPGIRPSQAAYLLGYSEPSAFNHAFRRWTGMSPSKFKDSCAQQ